MRRLLIGLALAGCDRPPSGEPSAPPPSARAPAIAAVTATATASARADASPFQGSWRGAFEAKRAPIELPKQYPWPAWRKDDGARLGNGSVAITVDAAGFVDGEASGALGPLKLRGRIDEGALRAGATAAADEAPAMTGTLVSDKVDGKAIHAFLRASSEDGEIVRVAEVTLQRK